MKKYKSQPLGHKDISKFAEIFRLIFKINKYEKLDVLWLLEHTISAYFKDFSWRIVKKLKPNQQAYADINNKEIVLLEEVYDGACAGDGRSRFTIMHEISHLFLISFQNVKLYCIEPNEKIKVYEDPEWQANSLASELLAPLDVIENMDEEEISEKRGISLDAAHVQKEKYLRLKTKEEKT
ncbi:MAG: ImmA/IrrE family metallo-endopeptidase [Mycoplasmataceae bacterium]|nr:ImmA/IrrE family metallo-endopeptidase [Mycoplasmataceae bacterium]